jgi:hypothetical protein
MTTARTSGGMSAARALRPSGHAEPGAPTFADVRRACEKWLLKHNRAYREASEAQKARAKRGEADELPPA